MATPFHSATAEQVLSAVDTVVANNGQATAEHVASFWDLPVEHARAALELASDLGLLSKAGRSFKLESLLARYVASPDQEVKAAILRLHLELYQPFTFFRKRLLATGDPGLAAQQTRVQLNLDAHRENVKETLLNLGTFSGALLTRAGGRYELGESSPSNPLELLVRACSDLVGAEQRVRDQLGPDASGRLSRDDVVLPLAEAVLKAGANNPEGAVQAAGNAVETALLSLGADEGVDLGDVPGIGGKVEALAHEGHLPKKLAAVGRYLGNIRNAADHGADAEVGAPWRIKESTGIEFVFVSCSFLASVLSRLDGNPPEI